MEHILIKSSSDSKLQLFFICSVRALNVLEVIESSSKCWTLIEGKPLFELFFKLFRLKDKQIRKTVHKFIVRDVKKINQKTKNHAVNKSLQNFMYTMLQDQDVTAAFKSLQVTEDLYKKQIWNDEKTVNVLSGNCWGHMSATVAKLEAQTI